MDKRGIVVNCSVRSLRPVRLLFLAKKSKKRSSMNQVLSWVTGIGTAAIRGFGFASHARPAKNAIRATQLLYPTVFDFAGQRRGCFLKKTENISTATPYYAIIGTRHI